MKHGRIKLTVQLRLAIDGSGKSRYEIAKETGIDEATLSRFMHGKGGLSMDGLDLITDYLKLDLRTTTRARPKKSR